MTTTRQSKTNLRCGSCVKTLKPHLDGEPGVDRWEVDLASPNKPLTVYGDAPAEAVNAAIAKGGYQVLGEFESAPPVAVVPQSPDPQPSLDAPAATTYYPLVLL